MRINQDAFVVDIIDQGYILEIKSFVHELPNKRVDFFTLGNEKLLKLAEEANINVEFKNELAPPRNNTTIYIPLKAVSLEKVVPENIIQFRGK